MTVVSFHLPRHTGARKAAFKELLENFWASLLAQNRRPEYLRLVEAAYRAAPLFMLIPVRWLLDPDREDDADVRQHVQDLLALDAWWVPRSLRPLRRLHRALIEAASHTVIDPAAQIDATTALNSCLREVLRSAWQLGDAKLFQEICTLVLKRVNYAIFRASDAPPGTAAILRDLYFAVIKAIEASLPLWIGGPREMQVRSVVAKNLVDGDTYWQLLCRISAEGTAGLWNEILMRRIEGVRQLVFKGDVLLSIEALRAANHSLLQLGRRLAEARRNRGAGPLTVVTWDVFEHYFQRLVFGAARALQLKPRLSDVLYHEYARTFALCLCACPEGVMPMVKRLAEMHLIVDPVSPDDLAQRICGQLEVLKTSFGVCSLDGMRDLITRFLSPNLDALDEGSWFKTEFLPFQLEREGWRQEPLDAIGKDFATVERSHGLARALRDLARNLSTDAQHLELLSYRCLESYRPPPDDKKLNDHFKHSLAYWRQVLDSLQRLVGQPGLASGDKIRPEMVLFSYKLATWARQQEGELNRRFKEDEIYQPQYRLFGELMQRLRRAAEGFSTVPEDVEIDELVRLAKVRWRIERDFQELKDELGLDHYEGRGWRGFHHHGVLCIAAYVFLAAERARLSPPAPIAFLSAARLPKDYRPRGSAAP